MCGYVLHLDGRSGNGSIREDCPRRGTPRRRLFSGYGATGMVPTMLSTGRVGPPAVGRKFLDPSGSRDYGRHE